IGEIKDRPEEGELISAPKREPGRELATDDGEIEHVNDLSVQKAGVPAFCWKELCFFIPGTFTEYHTIEGGVNDISQCTRENQRYVGYKSPVIFVSNQVIESVGNRD